MSHCLPTRVYATVSPETLFSAAQGTTPSPYESAAQLRKKRNGEHEEVGNGQDWRWQVNKRPKVNPTALIFLLAAPFMYLHLTLTRVAACTQMCWM